MSSDLFWGFVAGFIIASLVFKNPRLQRMTDPVAELSTMIATIGQDEELTVSLYVTRDGGHTLPEVGDWDGEDDPPFEPTPDDSKNFANNFTNN